MKTYRYETPYELIPKDDNGMIFLAGPTVRGNQPHLRPSWRELALEMLSYYGFDGSVIVPEFIDPTESDKDRPELPIWEFKGLEKSDIIVFWVPRTKELIGLTTNFEMGYWMAQDRNKIIYGRPDDSYRHAYNDIIWKYTSLDYHYDGRGTIYTTLTDTIQEAVKRIKQNREFEAKYNLKSVHE